MLETAWSACRPREITQWISAQNAKVDRGVLDESYRVREWVAIDDRPLLHESGGKALEGHFVQTNVRRGLTRALVDSIISCLRQMPAETSSAPTSPSSPSISTSSKHLSSNTATVFTATAPVPHEKMERAQPSRSTFPYSATASRALRRSDSASDERLAEELTSLRITSPLNGHRRQSTGGSTNESVSTARLRWDQFALA